MKIRAIILSALILCGISAVIMYSRAAQPLQKSSVITQAINDKNTPMVIKNLILKMKEQMEVNDDQFPELIKEVENYTYSCADSASVAVLHSMLAEMYQNYFQRNQWTINQRTQLSGYIRRIPGYGLPTYSRIRSRKRSIYHCDLRLYCKIRLSASSRIFWRSERTRKPCVRPSMSSLPSGHWTSNRPYRSIKT